MPIQAISCGPPTLLQQNVVYAMPAVKVTLACDASPATFQLSNTSDFASNQAVTLTGGLAVGITAGFIKCTNASPTVVLRRD